MMEDDVDVSSSMVMIGMPSDGLECRWIGALANLGTEREGGGRSGRMMRGLRRTCVREGMGGVGCEGCEGREDGRDGRAGRVDGGDSMHGSFGVRTFAGSDARWWPRNN